MSLLSEKELNYLRKMMNSDSALDPEVILSVINKKRNDDNHIKYEDIIAGMQTIESKESKPMTREQNTDRNSTNKVLEKAKTLKGYKDIDESVGQTTYLVSKILEELTPYLIDTLAPRKIKEYTILSGKTQGELSQNVRKYLEMGYQPLGGISAAAFGISPVGGNQYIQAMVKYSKNSIFVKK
jgi:hypothetical protein